MSKSKVASLSVRKIDAKVERSLRTGYVTELLTMISKRKNGMTKVEAIGHDVRCKQNFHDELKFCLFNGIIPDRTREGMQYRYVVPNLAKSLKALESATLAIRPAEYVFDFANSKSAPAKFKTAKLSDVFSEENRSSLKILPTVQSKAAILAFETRQKETAKAKRSKAAKKAKA